MIISKEDHFRSMIAISEVIDQTKAKLIYTVMTEFEKQMSDFALKYGMIRENRFHWYEYQDKATQDYYHQNNSTYPGINYVIPGVALSGGAELWFRIEVEYDLFAGLCLFDPSAKSEMGIGNQLDEPSEDVKNLWLPELIHPGLNMMPGGCSGGIFQREKKSTVQRKNESPILKP